MDVHGFSLEICGFSCILMGHMWICGDNHGIMLVIYGDLINHMKGMKVEFSTQQMGIHLV